MPDSDEFVRDTKPYRPELLAHCYRMLGSVHEAEDLVQETFLRAWRAYDGFEGRASLRTWLYQIATNACLNALEHRGRRTLPSGLGRSREDVESPLDDELPEITWLQPMPDALVPAETQDPAAIVTGRESMRLAMIAALQHLPARQRAVLILRDVLGWRAAEVAGLLDSTTAAVNSLLQRARAQLEQVSPAMDDVAEVDITDPELRELLDRYMSAFERADIEGLMALLTKDAVWEMPPVPTWFVGRNLISEINRVYCDNFGRAMRMVAITANGQPAFGVYALAESGDHVPDSVQVLTIRGGAVARVVAFHDVSLFRTFGLPAVLPARSTAST